MVERQAPRRVRRLIAVGGGRGGVGKTLLTVNLAVYLAQLGRSVAISDADPFGSGLHNMLGSERPPLALPRDIKEGRATPAKTSVPGLELLPTAYDLWAVAPKRPSRMAHWLSQLSQLDFDYVLLNLGASTTPATLDVFYEADVSICVAAPEPAAVETTYRFCRALFTRRLRRALMRERFKLRVVERALAALPPLPPPRDVVTEIARYDTSIAALAAATMQSLRPSLVVGKTRLKRDLDLGPAMSSLSDRYLGISLEYLGYIEHDDSVWLTARRRRPLLTDAPTSKSARNIERVARRLLALMAPQQERQQPQLAPSEVLGRLNAPLTLYDVLGIPRTAGDDEIRRAYKRQREIFRDESLPIVSLVDEPGVTAEQARIMEAYDTLLDPARKRAYDLSIFPDDEPLSDRPEERQQGPSAAELAAMQAELAREISPETQFSGALLMRAREAHGIELRDIAQQTKISPMHLSAIEAEDFDGLPAQVYVSGFLKQIAKVLGLDPAQVAKTYLKRYRAAKSGGGEQP
jgi:flagellar biosynthesis protein FlhG